MTMSSAVFGMPSAPTPVMICAKPCGVGDEVAVRIGAQQRHRADVLVGQEDAEHLGLRLDLAPGGHAARTVAPPPSISLPVACGTPLASSAYWRRNTWWEACERIGLVLVDERSRGVDGAHVVGRAHDAVGPRRNGRAGQHHEVRRAARHVQRIVRLKRDEHGAAAALVDEIQAVVEELAEQREPGVERGRQADVRGDVGDLDVVAVHRDAERLEGRIADVARGFQIGERDGVRRRRGGQGVERRLFGGAGRGGFVAVAESVCRGLGILHHHAGLILGVERGLEGVVDGLHQRDVGQVWRGTTPPGSRPFRMAAGLPSV